MVVIANPELKINIEPYVLSFKINLLVVQARLSPWAMEITLRKTTDPQISTYEMSRALIKLAIIRQGWNNYSLILETILIYFYSMTFNFIKYTPDRTIIIILKVTLITSITILSSILFI